MRKSLLHQSCALFRYRIKARSLNFRRPSSSVVRTAAPVSDDYTYDGGDETATSSYRMKVVSKAMEVYLKSARSYTEMMAKEREQYELGKRHLANIMGLDINTITQQDIDRLKSCL